MAFVQVVREKLEQAIKSGALIIKSKAQLIKLKAKISNWRA